MATVIADVGAPNANSYVTVAEADAYFDDTFGKPLWEPLDADTKSLLVITASRTLDQYIKWIGWKTDPDQGMEWPRSGTDFDVDVIPTKVKYATYELAYYLVENNGISFASQSVDSVKVGPVAVDFTEYATDAGIPSFIENLLAELGSPILVGDRTVRMARLVRT